LEDSEWNIYEKATSICAIGRLNTGVVFGVVFSKKCSLIGKKPSQNPKQRFSLIKRPKLTELLIIKDSDQNIITRTDQLTANPVKH